MNRKLITFVGLLSLFCFGCGGSQSDNKAVEILKKSDEACLKIKSIEYEETQIDAEQGENNPRVIANVKQARGFVPTLGIPGKYLISGKLNKNGKESTNFAYSYDGEYLRVLDSREKVVRVVEFPTPDFFGRMVAPFGQITFPQFSSNFAFKDLLETAKIIYEGTKEINGEPAHIIAITHTFENQDSDKKTSTFKWFIGTKDFLPRGFESKGFSKKIKILKVNDKATETDSFSIPTPEGYTEKKVS